MADVKKSYEESLDDKKMKESDNDSVQYVERIDSIGGNIVTDDSIEQTEVGKKTWLIAIIVSLGGFLFGYDTGVISSVLVTLGTDLGHTLTSSESELITSLTSGGALVGAVIAGLTADKYGRKLAIYLGCALFFAGSLIQATSFGVPQMSAGRFIVGLGVGLASMIIPMYISELAPARYRGRMIGFDNLSITCGQLISYALGAGLTHVGAGWRWMVAIGAVPAVLLTFLLPLCPDSPRQLLAHGKKEDARDALRTIFPNATELQLDNKMSLIEYGLHEVAEIVGDKSLWWQMKQLFAVPANLRALTCACVIMAVCQLSGFNSLMYFSATLFGLVGFKNATAVSIVVGAANFIFTLANMLFIDRYGRRKILLWTVIGMSISLIIIAAAFSFIPLNHNLDLIETPPRWASLLVLIFIIIYIAFYASGVATIGWVGTELLPMEVRSVGTMMNTVTCWGCNIIIASTFLSMMKGITGSGAFGFYAGICFFGWIFIVFCYPEVKGLALEEVREVYQHGFGVRYARELQKTRKSQAVSRA
ncbi:hypothetical protein MBLNU459_g2377t4 [Dothideomycetes sp. NU459]